MKKSPSKPGRKRNRLQRLTDIIEADRLAHLGHTQEQIRNVLNARKDRPYQLTRQQIAYDLKEARRWLAELWRDGRVDRFVAERPCASHQSSR